MQRLTLTIFILLTSYCSFGQSLVMKYVDADIAMKDLKKNGKQSQYYNTVDPSDLLFLNCKFYDDIIALYDIKANGISDKSDYCNDSKTASIWVDQSIKNFRDIFDHDQAIKKFLKDLLGENESKLSRIDFPVCLYNNQALMTLYGSHSSTTYRLTLLDNKVIYFPVVATIE
ncbi:MAG: hypothetical protein POELPBGB_01604 [Bacteroidia bacterium]|nr:hypothetical protein [Bacteroidia bacterium]